MDFRFSAEERVFIAEVKQFLGREKAHPDAEENMAPDRESDSWFSDTPERRAFNKRLGEAGYLGMSWDSEYGGKGKGGIYDYLLNEELSGVGAPLIGKGVGCIGKTIIAHGSEALKKKFLPKILNAEIEFALGYSEPGAGSDLASVSLRAQRRGDEWVLNGQKMWTSSAHFADWCWVAARTDPSAAKHKGISVFLVPMDHPGLTITEIKTLGGHRTNQVFYDDVCVSNDYLVGEVNKGWTYVCEALDFERFTLYTVSPLLVKLDVLVEMLKITKRDGVALSQNPVIRSRMALLASEVETAKMLQRRVICGAMKNNVPTVEAAMYKLYSTVLGRRMADFALDTLGPLGLLESQAAEAPLNGKWEKSYRATVVDTIGGGTSEIQKNIIARRGLQLP
jgi:alkylation response protein AidB-like acyl-CoA dehydrogenase